ncbi:MAG: hypothetical protein HY021_08390 [Burkholderiales bacterium]|nr:hypothetical protein [Burkholderiales bacterium]
MPDSATVIRLHPLAPPKPALVAPCNGCGACCAYEPCPVGMLLSRRTRGACVALRWTDSTVRYQCGLLAAPREVLRWLPARVEPALRRLARRWIGAGIGCDFDAEVQAKQAF